MFWRGRKTLVTGGAGFIGSHLCDRLIELGARVRIVDNLERGRLDNLRRCLADAEFRQQDLRDQAVAHAACDGIEVVFHLASKVGGIGYYLSRPGEVLATNLLLDALVLDAALAAGVGRYVYASSGFVYPAELQQQPDAPALKEEDALPAKPAITYGWAKLMGEMALEAVAGEGHLRGASLRLVGAFGPRQDTDLDRGSAIPVFIRRAVEYPERRPFVVKGTGRETRSFCYISDFIDAFVLAAERLGDGPLPPLNVGSEGRLSIGALAGEVIAVSGKDIPVEYAPATTAIWGQAVDCTRARNSLGWEPRVTLREGLARSYAYIEESLKEGRGVLPG